VRPFARLALAALAVLPACKGGQGGPRTRPPPAVAVAKVEVRDVPVEVRAPVDLRPLVQADVGAKTLGYLDAVLVDRGDQVKRGQVLALVRPSDLPDQLEAARVAFELAKANKDRAEKLAPTGVVSEQELQGAQTQYQATSAQLAALGVRLGEAKITSPLDGVVSQRRLDPGVLVGPNAGTGPILQVQRVDVLRVFVPVNERDAAGVHPGLTAHVEFDALAGRRFTGKVVRVSPGFDPVARTLDAEVHLTNPGDLRPGMYGRGAIVTEVHKDALVVPVAAVQISDQRTFVYLVQGDKVRRVEVKTGVDGGDWLEIVSGLSGGDEIVTAGTDVLSDGSAVRPVRGVDPFSGAAASAAKGPQ
jgi:membrane fusion protein (multidrug efflux system)